jgi:hypothetical protein
MSAAACRRSDANRKAKGAAKQKAPAKQKGRPEADPFFLVGKRWCARRRIDRPLLYEAADLGT